MLFAQQRERDTGKLHTGLILNSETRLVGYIALRIFLRTSSVANCDEFGAKDFLSMYYPTELAFASAACASCGPEYLLGGET